MNHKKIVVVKVGSSLVTRQGHGLDEELLGNWISQISRLQKLGYAVILVSSGAIAEGLKQLNWAQRPQKIRELQAAAAVGQMGLAQTYQRLFRKHGLTTAQILLTHEDLRDRRRYLNARATLTTLLNHEVVPVVNENDTVVTAEIKLGDNDTLGAVVVNLIEAELYIILTDQEGLYNADPRTSPAAVLLEEVKIDNPDLEKMAGGAGSYLGTGGMLTKIKAARRAALSGAVTIVASGKYPDVLVKIITGAKAIGTRFVPGVAPEHSLRAKEQWMLDQLIIAGTIFVDAGAARAINSHEHSLLPIGGVKVSGEFNRGDVVAIKDESGKIIARGLSNYAAAEARQILGCNSGEIVCKLGYSWEDELIHRDNMVFIP